MCGAAHKTIYQAANAESQPEQQFFCLQSTEKLNAEKYFRQCIIIQILQALGCENGFVTV